MATIPFWKLQSTQNDFPLVHLDDVEAAGISMSDLAVRICDRHTGVGGDGLLAMRTGAIIEHRMFNPDGTEDFCGNGLRCGAVHAVQMGWAQGNFELHHLDRVVPILVEGNKVTARLGTATYAPAMVPVARETELFDDVVFSGEGLTLRGSTLSTGSTHTIIPVDSLPDDEFFLRISPLIEVDARFPERTSIMWAQTVGPDHLAIRIFERGVGETFGCGTGSSAAAVDYLRRAGRGGTVRVDNPGGTVFVALDKWDGEIVTSGEAFQTFCGEFAL